MISINNTQIFNSSSKSIRDFEEENAIKIQKVWRGFSQRDSYPCAFFGEMIRCDARLPLPFRPAYSDLCKESTLSVMEKAKGGKTTVYLPTTLPIVIKECGREKAIDRLYKMIVVRSFSRPFSNIVVPKAALHGKFMIEERLPINIDRYHNVRTYLDNLPLFDQAVKDMVYLFFKV
ncbi:MAG: hypothetical protein JSS09_00750, partial [Verrucomicrobia bacterium]|nr:hypothetical protein [Verrucomicrobiota bacterium]